MILICIRAEEHSLREKQCNIVLKKSHVVSVSLKSVDHYKKMNASVVVLALTAL
jgi:hypothetical protein